ncbi:hypothetical protein AAFF_G00433970 [Aldrovandia affinis]|uniref:Uncharacterized protein n=1 Tax=Aldrovandia affinis TaxID=143900 RepID=A0AAD7WI61_9TELE|nr:hypothetical protein AAFF_G00433970 [Aldrovandia affinis]
MHRAGVKPPSPPPPSHSPPSLTEAAFGGKEPGSWATRYATFETLLCASRSDRQPRSEKTERHPQSADARTQRHRLTWVDCLLRRVSTERVALDLLQKMQTLPNSPADVASAVTLVKPSFGSLQGIDYNPLCSEPCALFVSAVTMTVAVLLVTMRRNEEEDGEYRINPLLIL